MDNVRHLRPEESGDRKPPQDIDAEMSALGGMLLSRDAIADVTAALDPRDYYRPAHETIHRAIVDMHRRGDPADPITVTAELTKRGEINRVGGASYLHTLVSAVPTAANAGYYAEIVRDTARRRRLIEAATRAVQMGYSEDGELDDVLAKIRGDIEDATQPTLGGGPGHLVDSLLDWTPFFEQDFGRVQLLPGRLMAPGQQITLVGDGKAGKSLFTQEWAWRMATGQSFLDDAPQAPVSVLYLDAENGQETVQERLVSFGAGPGRMGLLSYASFPAIRPLDTPGGGADLLAMARAVEAAVVVIDTVSRFVSGPENDADTWRALYRLTLMPMKAAGLASIRLDHLGKDKDRGARGSSAKTQDVDHVWTLTAQGGGALALKRTHTRTGIGPDEHTLIRHARRDGDRWVPGETRHEVMRFEHRPERLPGTPEFIAAALDRAGVPVTYGRDRLRDECARHGIAARTDALTQVARIRKARAAQTGTNHLTQNLTQDEITTPDPKIRSGRDETPGQT